MRIKLKDSVRMREAAEQERRAMMAYITHDLQTPITSIIGYADGIIDGVASTRDKTLEYAEIIRKKARTLSLLAEDLSLLSRLENAQLPLDIRDEDFSDVIRSVLADFTADHPDAEVTANLRSDVTVPIDRSKMLRVLANILQNSVKYKKPDTSAPKINITLESYDGAARLTLSDDGVGVSKADLPRLCDRFYRADSSRGTQSGSGLGLSIARELIKLQGGKIWLNSNPGGGLTVNITVPLKERD